MAHVIDQTQAHHKPGKIGGRRSDETEARHEQVVPQQDHRQGNHADPRVPDGFAFQEHAGLEMAFYSHGDVRKSHERYDHGAAFITGSDRQGNDRRYVGG